MGSPYFCQVWTKPSGVGGFGGFGGPLTFKTLILDGFILGEDGFLSGIALSVQGM